MRSRTGLVACAALALLCGLLADDTIAEETNDDEGRYVGRRLVKVLAELREAGFDLVFSSAVVDRGLRVPLEPSETEPRAALESILAAVGLRAEEGPGGALLIVPAPPTTASLRGRVISRAGAYPVLGATVRLRSTHHSATAGVDGAYEIEGIRPGSYDLVAEAPGFDELRVRRLPFAADAELERTIELTARAWFATEVVVTPGTHSVVLQEQSAGRVVTGEQALLAPTIGGDVSRVIELLPGVAAADGSAAFNVRGSTTGDVSFVLDGLELYDPFHLESFQSPFSLIDSNVVDRIDFFGGGYTADLGDRHGGFVEISTVADQESSRGELELGTLNSRATFRDSLAGGAGSWLLSVRGWYPEAVQDTTELGGGENLDPRFADAYFKASFRPKLRHRVSVHGLLSYDRLTFVEKDEEINETVDARTRNAYAWIRAQSAWSSAWTSETIFSGGRIDRERSGISATDEPILVDDERTVDFLGLEHDSIRRASDRHLVKAGFFVRWLQGDYRYVNAFPESPAADTLLRLDADGTSLGLYAAHRVRVTPALATELGARWDRQTYTNDNQLSPRFNAVLRLGERTEARVAVGRFSQSERIHELQVEDGETEFGRAEAAEQAELSLDHGFAGGVHARLDVYERKLTHLRTRYENAFEPVELFPETIEDRVRLSPDAARLRGIELLVRGDDARPLFWWFSYALSSAKDELDGNVVPRSWDQTHAAKFLVGYRRDERWSVSLSGSSHTGWPTTPAVGVEATTASDGSIELSPILGARNSARFPRYERFDFKTRRALTVPRGRLWLTLEVVNLTDRDNACCLDEFRYSPRPDGSFSVRPGYDYWLGRTASFNLLWQYGKGFRMDGSEGSDDLDPSNLR